MSSSKTSSRPGEQEDFVYLDGRWTCNHTHVADAGLVRFFRALTRGRLLAGYCETCDETSAPLRARCDRCLTPIEKNVTLGTGGSVRAASVIQVPMSGLENPPGTIACVQPDGSATAMLTSLLSAEGEACALPPQDLIGRRCELRVASDATGRWEDFWFELTQEVEA